MTQQAQLQKLLDDLYNGSPWIDVNFTDTLNEITAKEAATKPFPHFNSIWEIVNHVISWRETLLKRIQGEEIESPEDNYFSYIPDRTESAWEKTKEHFKASQQQWTKALKKMKKKDLDEMDIAGKYSVFDLVNGIIQHDAYHLGQIRLLRKMVQLT